MSIEGHLRAGSFNFFDRHSCFGLALVESYTQFPHGSPPIGLYGCFGDQQIIKGFVGNCPELYYVLQGTDVSGSGNGGNWGDAGGDVL